MANNYTAHPLAAPLTAHPCFALLTTKQQERLLAAARPFLFQAEEPVLTEGQPAAGIWWIESGAVKVYKANADGGEQILHIAGSGETFNDVAVYDRGGNPANVAALTPAKIWLLPAGVIHTSPARRGFWGRWTAKPPCFSPIAAFFAIFAKKFAR
jgi:CRP-like cAMP-binding protein